MAEAQRYLLCRPRGGLNDTLCQIERCWDYADRYGRLLIVDARRSGLLTDCADYFEPRVPGPILTLSDPRLVGLDFDAMTCRPAMFEGRTSYLPRLAPGQRPGQAVGTHTSFDLSIDHPETLLVHESHGGCRLAREFLTRVRFTQPVAAQIRSALAALGPIDAALHLRNTDYRTILPTVFAQLRPKLDGRRLLVCSDDAGTIAAARSALDRTEIVTVTEPFFSNGRRLHEPETYSNDTDRRKATVNSLIDLCALASANELFVAQLRYGNYSGFSLLAGFLCHNRDVLAQMLGADLGESTPGRVTRIEAGPRLARLLPFLGWTPRNQRRFRRFVERLVGLAPRNRP